MGDISLNLQNLVRRALDDKSTLFISGGNTKGFFGRPVESTCLDMTNHAGVILYEPTELVITARSGTALSEIEAALAEKNQMLAFEPPHFGDRATLGGTVASGLSGPRRPFAGSVRDFVLGCKLLNGKAQILSFGGQVMKNVAGYDVSRLMVGALGTLGVLLEVSLKVLPKPPLDETLALEMGFEQAIQTMNSWSGRPLPLSALTFDGHRLFVRLSESRSAIDPAKKLLGGEIIPQGDEFWKSIRDHSHAFFQSSDDLWRVSLAPNSPNPKFPVDSIIEWGGAQRWFKTTADPGTVFDFADQVGGHATLFRSANSETERFHPLTEKLMRLHKNLKHAFDPAGILNPGRLYKDF